MNILVVGCERLGSRVANELFEQGHTVSVVDSNPQNFYLLSDDFDGITVLGTPMDMKVLREAGIESCDAVAVVTSDDNLNITVSQIVKEFFYIDNVLVRINDPAREQVFYNLGLKTVCPTNLACGVLTSAITQEFVEKQINFGVHTLSINAREIDHRMIGRSLNSIPVKSSESIIGVTNSNGKLLLFDGRQDIVLNPHDRIIYARISD